LYTLPEIQPENKALYFDNRHLGEDATGRLLLHRQPLASEEDYIPLDSDLISGDLDTKDRHVRPCFIIKIAFQKDAPLLSLNRQDIDLRQFYIVFASNRTFWKYYLMGELSSRSFFIADLDNTIEFEDVGNAILPGNRAAKIMQSTSAIPMLEKPVQRLQLKEWLDQRDKVVIKRLPNASIDQINGEMVNGKMENISEIYIH